MSNTPKRSSRAQGQAVSTLLFKFSRKEMITWHEMRQFQQPHGPTPLHCLAMALLSNCQNLQKVGHDIVIFNGNVLGHVWHTWCKKCTNGKRMSCSLLICHMQIFKSIDFRTMGLWIWITFFFDTHCIIYWFLLKAFIKNLNLKKCFLFFAECIQIDR